MPIEPDQVYLIRYGVMSRVARFAAAAAAAFDRGQHVVVNSPRGVERGEVLARLDPRDACGLIESRVLRRAEAADHKQAQLAEERRIQRLAVCDQFFQVEPWNALTLLDLEVLLDVEATVLHVLGLRAGEAPVLCQAILDRVGLEVMVEPVGRDDEPDSGGCGPCGSGGGCGSASTTDASVGRHACGSGGCGSGGCGLKDLLKSRPHPAHT